MKYKAIARVKRSMTINSNLKHNHIGCDSGQICDTETLNNKLHVLDSEYNYICSEDEELFKNFEVMR